MTTPASDPVAEVRSALRRRKFAGIIAGEIIVSELVDFLEEHYPDGRAEALLDLGAGTQPYAPIYRQHFSTCVSVDVAHSPHDVSAVDTLASADALPFAAGAFDCVVCTEVLEHCRDPAGVMKEIARVLRCGGRVFLTTPFMAPLHEMPYDYYRYTPVALEDLARSAGLQATLIRPRGDYMALLTRLLTLPFAKLWYGLSRLTTRHIYSYRNPLLYVTVVAPQLLYLAAWRRMAVRPEGLLARLHGRLAYYAPGYVTTLVKPAT